MNSDFKVTIRRKPDERHVPVRFASQIVNLPLDTLKECLGKTGKYEDKRYIISMPASHIEAKEDTDPTSPLINPVIPPWRRK